MSQAMNQRKREKVLALPSYWEGSQRPKNKLSWDNRDSDAHPQEIKGDDPHKAPSLSLTHSRSSAYIRFFPSSCLENSIAFPFFCCFSLCRDKWEEYPPGLCHFLKNKPDILR